MRTGRTRAMGLLFAIIVVAFQLTALAQDRDTSFATLSSTDSSVKWTLKVTSYSSATLSVVAPDGRVFRKDLKAGATPEFTIVDRDGSRLPDGHYSYELRLNPVISKETRETLLAARGKDDEPESVRSTRKRVKAPDQVQSGSFSIMNGTIYVPGSVEESASRPSGKTTELQGISESTRAVVARVRKHHLSPMLVPDQVIPDDLIVQGSECVGFDCVNNEVFDFDTIRMKENNTRLQFSDTSTSPGFPTNNWQLRANDSPSGGGSFLGFVDQGANGTSESGTISFRVDAGASTNALRVSSTSRVGLRTAAPVLDLHITTSNTPAHRLEQTSAGGFSAQTWDIAGNEANFFVRDVTSGSRLPFRIRPGAPTSSLDISADGDVGIGTAGPDGKLHLFNSGATDNVLQHFENGTRNWSMGINGASDFFRITDQTVGAARLTILNSGFVGIGTTSPTDTLSVNGTASKPGGGSWAVFSDKRLKNIRGTFNSGLNAVMQLQPVRYVYKANNPFGIRAGTEHIGFGAETLQQIIPEAVTKNAEGYLMVQNDPIIWTMLNAIKEQQREIEKLKGEVRRLRAATRRKR